MIFLKHKIIKNAQANGYRVFKTKDEFEDVDAGTAFEAAEKSTFKDIYKIEKLSSIKKTIFDGEDLDEKSEGTNPAVNPEASANIENNHVNNPADIVSSNEGETNIDVTA